LPGGRVTWQQPGGRENDIGQIVNCLDIGQIVFFFLLIPFSFLRGNSRSGRGEK
jgi:hypothetical protein